MQENNRGTGLPKAPYGGTQGSDKQAYAKMGNICFPVIYSLNSICCPIRAELYAGHQRYNEREAIRALKALRSTWAGKGYKGRITSDCSISPH